MVGEADGRGKYLGDVDPTAGPQLDAVAARAVLAAGEREVGLCATSGWSVVRWTTDEITRHPARV